MMGEHECPVTVDRKGRKEVVGEHECPVIVDRKGREEVEMWWGNMSVQ